MLYSVSSDHSLLQVMKILAALNKRGRKEVTVGSTEQFQGRERLVIIISTVRSEDKPSGSDSLKSLGFLTNEKVVALLFTLLVSRICIITVTDGIIGLRNYGLACYSGHRRGTVTSPIEVVHINN